MSSKSRQSTNKQQDSDIQHVRRQARTRLIGALILIFILVSMFSILLQQSRQTSVSDIPFIKATSQPRVVIPETLPPQPTFVPQAAETARTPVIDVPKIKPAPPQATTKARTGAVQINTKVKPKPEPKPKPKPKSEVKIDTKLSGQWVVQLGAFRNPKSVAAALKKAGKNGIQAFTSSVNTATGKLTRVQVGPFASKAEAKKAVTQLKSIGFKDPRVKKPQQ